MNRREFLKNVYRIGGIVGLCQFMSYKDALAFSPTIVCSGVNSAGGGAYNVSFVSSDRNVDSSGDVTVTAPTGIQDGDLLVAVFSVDVGSGVTDTPPSGFTEVLGDVGPTSGQVTFLYQKTASSESGNYTFQSDQSDWCSAHIAVFRKTGGSWTDLTTASYSNESDDSGSSLTTGSVTTQDDSILFCAWVTSATTSQPSSAPVPPMTKVEGVSQSGLSMYSYYQNIATGAATTKSLTWDFSGSMSSVAAVIYAS